MALKEYEPGTTFPGRMGRTIGESDPAWPSPVRAKEGAPNVLFIVIDDTGFGQLGCYGSPINTPNIDKLAKNGLLFTNMHTTALCSPSRSCILTGRNHHSNACPASPRDRPAIPAGMARYLSKTAFCRTYCCSKATPPIASASGT
jgi:Sulfatase